MALRLPSEIVVERFLPTVRASLATELRERGFTQEEIARELGVTQAAVSKHLAGDVRVDERIVNGPGFQGAMDRIADGIEAETATPYDVMAELMALVDRFEDRGPICAIHEDEMPALAGIGCDLCVRGPDEAKEAERAVLTNVRRAGRLLAGADVPAAIPNVGTNIGMALPDARSPTDVAAIPGRIYRMRGSVVVPAEPEFGASEHVATTILAAMSAVPDRRGAVNIATSSGVIERARQRNLNPVEFDPAYEDRSARLRSVFEAADPGNEPTVLYHHGAFGVEPVTYVLGTSAIDAVELALGLLDEDEDEDEDEAAG